MTQPHGDKWQPLDPKIGYWEGSYEFAPGARSRSVLVKLGHDRFLVYSPGPSLIESALTLGISEQSEIFILAPNSFHSMGIRPWLAKFPKSRFFAENNAQKRLLRITRCQAEDLNLLSSELPTHIKIWPLPHCRIGEVWLTIEREPGNDLVVCDSFFNLKALASKGLMKWFMLLNRMGPGLEISRVFALFGFTNKSGYCQWLTTTFGDRQLIRMLPAHGQHYQDPQLITTLAKLVQKRLR